MSADNVRNAVEMFLSQHNFEGAWEKFEARGFITGKSVMNLNSDQLSELLDTEEEVKRFMKEWTAFSEQVLQNVEKDKQTPTTSSNEDDVYASASVLFRKIGVQQIKEILEADFFTNLILYYVQHGGLMTKAFRDRIVKRIVGALLKDTIKDWSYPHYLTIAKSICAILNGEKVEDYYVAPIPKHQSKTGESVAADGPIANAFKNALHFYRLMKKTAEKRPFDRDQDSDSKRLKLNVPEDKAVEEALKLLKTIQGPLALVKKLWQITSDARRQWLLANPHPQVDVVFKDWPILILPIASILILIDFAHLNKSTVTLTEANWEAFFKTILESKTIPAKDTEGLSLQKKLNDSRSNTAISKDAHVVAQLSLLPHLIRNNTNRGKEKYSPLDAKKTLIHVVKLEADVLAVQEERIKALGRLIIQPYLVIVAANPEQPTSFYVCLKDRKYPMTSALEALDLCFKFYHVLDGHYPLITSKIWYLIQRGLYQFREKNEKQLSSLNTLIAKIVVAVNSAQEPTETIGVDHLESDTASASNSVPENSAQEPAETIGVDHLESDTASASNSVPENSATDSEESDNPAS